MADSTSPDFSSADAEYMALALRLAARGRYTAHPNPRVGCVIVNEGRVVGEGWHQRTGEAHAEVHALGEAGEAARGATAYVTFEPCSHHGRTPPCSDALIAAGVSDVVYAAHDPFEKVAGSGAAALSQTGIKVRAGLSAAASESLNRGFLSRIQRGRPFLRLKMAASLDGATAMASGESQWITGTGARGDVQKLRAESGAIITGIGTVLADDPSLTVRRSELTTRQPLRVVIDSQLRMPPSACMLALDGDTAIFCANDKRKSALGRMGATVYRCDNPDGQVDLHKVLGQLADLEINDALVEAGPALAGAFLASGLVDELVIYQAPHIMGSETRRMFETPGWQDLADRVQLTITDVRQVGADLRITATP